MKSGQTVNNNFVLPDGTITMKRLSSSYAALVCCCALLSSANSSDAAPAVRKDVPGSLSKADRDRAFREALSNAKAQTDKLAKLRNAGREYDSNDAWKAIGQAELLAKTFGEEDARVADVEMLWGRYKPLIGNVTTEHYESALAIREKHFGANSVAVEEALAGLAPQLARSGKYSESADAIKRAIGIMEHNKGLGAAQVAESVEMSMNYGLASAGDSKRLALKVMRSMKTVLKPTDPIIPRMMMVVAKTAMSSPRGYPYPKGTQDTAVAMSLEAIEAQKKSGGDKLELARMYEALAKRQSDNGEALEAVKTYDNVLSLRSTSSINDPRVTAHTYDTYADLLRRAQKMPDAEQYKKKALAVWEANPGSSDLNLINGLSSIIYFFQAEPAKALKYTERRTELCLKHNPDDMSAVESLAKLYMQLKNYAKAEPMLEKWYAMRDREGRSRGPTYVNSDLVPIAESLCEAETSLGKIAEAEQHINRAKRYYDESKNRFAMFGERYPQRFLEVYTQFLLKAGKVAEYNEYSTRLNTLKTKIDKACIACGMG